MITILYSLFSVYTESETIIIMPLRHYSILFQCKKDKPSKSDLLEQRVSKYLGSIEPIEIQE